MIIHSRPGLSPTNPPAHGWAITGLLIISNKEFSEVRLHIFLHWQPGPGFNEHNHKLSRAHCAFAREHALLSSPVLSILSCDYQKILMHSTSRNVNQSICSARLRAIITKKEAQCFPPTPAAWRGADFQTCLGSFIIRDEGIWGWCTEGMGLKFGCLVREI